jgi:photosynthetic reaction center cytochrome c subunit
MKPQMKSWAKPWTTILCLSIGALAAGCDGPPVDSKQQGFRGTGMVQVDSPKLTKAKLAANAVPKADALAKADGPRAKAEYKNVPVLGDLSKDEFDRLMLAVTEWVAPDQGCAYCHKVDDLASDTVPTKIVSRRMFQMTAHINKDWKSHVVETGVTCYTCHRGKPVPANIWYNGPQTSASAYAGNLAGKNVPGYQVGLTSLQNEPFSSYMERNETVRVAATDSLPIVGKTGATILKTEETYALMMNLSQSLGVNCTFCHNTQAFSDWSQSSPQRVTAWHGLSLTRDLNKAYLLPLKPNLAAERLGPSGDAPKLNCATCHQGVNKPLNGVSMLKSYPELAKAKQ